MHFNCFLQFCMEMTLYHNYILISVEIAFYLYLLMFFLYGVFMRVCCGMPIGLLLWHANVFSFFNMRLMYPPLSLSESDIFLYISKCTYFLIELADLVFICFLGCYFIP